MCHTYHFTYPCGHTRTLLTSSCPSLLPYALTPTPGRASPVPRNDTHPNTAPNHATSSHDLGDPGDGCRVCMVRDGVLEVEMLAPPYTRAAGGSVGGERDEEMAARWESMPNEVIPAPVRQAAAPAATPRRSSREVREEIVERVRQFTLRRMNAAAAAAGGAPASSPLVSSPLAAAAARPVSSAGDPPPPTTTAGPAPR